MRLLVVEDETKTASYLRQGLSENGFVVDVADNGYDAEHLALEGDYALILLDVMLPGADGWQVIQAIRRRKNVPVLFLTARGRVEDKVKGLELGADDYLVKPFSFSELLARVRALVRRGQHIPSQVLQIGDLEVDPIKRRVSRVGRRIDLTAKEFSLLWLFMRKKGEVLPRAFIAEQVWDMNFDSDTNVVDVAVRRLRAKVDDEFPRKLIHTVRGIGYVLEER